MRDYLARNWPTIVIRFFLCTLGFMAWREGTADKLVEIAGRIWGASLPNIIASALPATRTTVAIYGFFSDSIWDWLVGRFIPSLQKELPVIPEGPDAP
jgi:hypothetical protein